MTRDGNGGLVDYVRLKSAIDLCLVTVLGLDFGIPAEMTRLLLVPKLLLHCH